MKIRPVGAELFHANRHDVADSRFSQFLNALNDQSVMHKEIIPICSELHTLNTLCGQNLVFFNFKRGGT